MNRMYRCSCPPKPVLAEMRGEYVFIKKHGYLIFSGCPVLLKCGNCDSWYEIVYTGDMQRLTQIEAMNRLGTTEIDKLSLKISQ